MSTYEPLPDKRSIRVLVVEPGEKHDPIKSSLQCFSLDGSSNYNALSYVWGDPTIRQPIQVKLNPDSDFSEFQATVNLVAVLRRLRHKTVPITLWVDAICINQTDNDEKSWQIQLMGEIYERAAEVMIWLGEHEDAHEVIDCINLVLSYFPPHVLQFAKDPAAPKLFHEELAKRKSEGKRGLYDHDFDDLHVLLQRPWFQRKWIIQECALAKQAKLYFGDQELPWEEFEGLFVLLKNVDNVQSFARTSQVVDTRRGLTNLMCLIEIRTSVREDRQQCDLLTCARRSAQFLCFDPHDHIYGLIGIASDTDVYGIIPNYSCDIATVYRDIATRMLKVDKTLRLLGVHTDPDIAPHEKLAGAHLPSWVPDWTRIDISTALDKGTAFKATLDTSPELSFENDGLVLRIKGFRLGEIKTTVAHMSTWFLDESRHPSVEDQMWLEHWDVKEWITDAWFKTCRQVAMDTDPTLVQNDGFWRTLLCDQMIAHGQPTGTPPPAEHGQHVLGYFNSLEALLARLRVGDRDNNRNIAEQIQDHMVVIEQPLNMYGWQRRFFSTTSRQIGQGPISIQEGDVVCLLYGGCVPYILRPIGDGTFSFVGHCYLHGAMYGKAMEVGPASEEFMIH